MATCVLGHLAVGEPDTSTATECADCRFDVVLAFPVHLITERGVTPFGHVKKCVRCYEEADAP